jgi:hypothetical protein
MKRVEIAKKHGLMEMEVAEEGQEKEKKRRKARRKQTVNYKNVIPATPPIRRISL